MQKIFILTLQLQSPSHKIRSAVFLGSSRKMLCNTCLGAFVVTCYGYQNAYSLTQISIRPRCLWSYLTVTALSQGHHQTSALNFSLSCIFLALNSLFDSDETSLIAHPLYEVSFDQIVLTFLVNTMPIQASVCAITRSLVLFPGTVLCLYACVYQHARYINQMLGSIFP